MMKLGRYFSDLLSVAVFRKQENEFVNNNLGDKYIQLYFEEAHNLLPPDSRILLMCIPGLLKKVRNSTLVWFILHNLHQQ